MDSLEDLIEIFTNTTDKDKMKHLFDELFTTKEQSDFALRWSLMNDLYQGIPQREIAANHKISLCKITRGSKILKKEDSYCKKILSDRYDDHLHL
ncbi:MAG: Trp family transcriptional regulator [Sphaerochaeta sp.]|jgi:TrpR family trp operon transcriptional repressor